MGLYQVVAFLFGMIFPGVMSVAGYLIGAEQMWKIIGAQHAAGELTQLQAYKWLFLAFAVGASMWIASLAMTETIDELLPWFNTYNVASEAVNDGSVDADGTSLTFDLAYHEFTLVSTYMCVVGGITLPTVIGTYLALSDVVAAL